MVDGDSFAIYYSRLPNSNDTKFQSQTIDRYPLMGNRGEEHYVQAS